MKNGKPVKIELDVIDRSESRINLINTPEID